MSVRRTRLWAFALASGMVAAAIVSCAPTIQVPSQVPSQVPGQGQSQDQATPSRAAARLASGTLTAAETLSVFRQVCWQTTPDFLGARQAMADAGLTDRRDTGAVYAPGGAISAKIQKRPSGGGVLLSRCSVISRTDERDALAAALARLAGAAPRQSIVAQRQALVWDIGINGRAARILMIQPPARPGQIALYLDVPSARTSA